MMTTVHTQIVLNYMKHREAPVTTTELVALIPAAAADARLTLGIMVRCRQIHRSGWTPAGLSLWKIGSPP